MRERKTRRLTRAKTTLPPAGFIVRRAPKRDRERRLGLGFGRTGSGPDMSRGANDSQLPKNQLQKRGKKNACASLFDKEMVYLGFTICSFLKEARERNPPEHFFAPSLRAKSRDPLSPLWQTSPGLYPNR